MNEDQTRSRRHTVARGPVRMDSVIATSPPDPHAKASGPPDTLTIVGGLALSAGQPPRVTLRLDGDELA